MSEYYEITRHGRFHFREEKIYFAFNKEETLRLVEDHRCGSPRLEACDIEGLGKILKKFFKPEKMRTD